jgi:hypothetical protein
MKRSMLVLLVISSVVIFAGCQKDSSLTPEVDQSAQVPKPGPNLIGILATDFTWTPPTFWNGTVEFEEEGTYAITFISYDPPRPFSQASPFYEDFFVYELGTDWTNPENVYLAGWNQGVVVYANNPPDPCTFVANGKIDEAYGPFEGWQGRNVHNSGTITWVDVGVPEGVLGTFKLN